MNRNTQKAHLQSISERAGSGACALKHPIIGVSALIMSRRRALLIKRAREPSKGLWSLPGGKVEWHETLIDAVRREVREETGLALSTFSFGEYAEIIQPDHHFVIAVFTTRLTCKAPVIAGDDAQAACWFSMDEIKALYRQDTITETSWSTINRFFITF